jgi:S1-C subfamily serine protease
MLRLPRRPRAFLATALAAASLGGAGVGIAAYTAFDDGGGTAASAAPQATAGADRPTAQTSSPLGVSDIYRRVSPGVVEILATTNASNSSPFPFGQSGAQQAQGSGFVYDDQGHIVTNEHVVSGADSVTVKFQNGATSKARVVGTDASTDLAVLQVDATKSLLHPLTLGDSSKVEVGDGVVAIGSPFGLENSVTSGIVSGLNRQITAPNDFAIDGAIQTDAAINHGNSGGPLLDTSGQVIGVTSQIKSDSGGNEGVGFAVPSNTVRSVVSQLISSGKVAHAYLGVAVQTIPADVAKTIGTAAGAEVTQVRSGTGAAKASLHGATGQKSANGLSYPTGGDVITKVGGTTITSADQLRSVIDGKRPGDRITITYVRNGASKTVQVTLGARPS